MTIFERIGDAFISWWDHNLEYHHSWLYVVCYDCLIFTNNLQDANVQRSKIGILHISVVSQDKGRYDFLFFASVNMHCFLYQSNIPGNYLRVWRFFPAIHRKTWDLHWPQFAWVKSQGRRFCYSLLPEDWSLLSSQVFWDLTVFCLPVTVII